MHIDQVIRRASETHSAATCCTGSLPMASVEASLVGACYLTSKSTCQAAEHGSNAHEHSIGGEHSGSSELREAIILGECIRKSGDTHGRYRCSTFGPNVARRR